MFKFSKLEMFGQTGLLNIENFRMSTHFNIQKQFFKGVKILKVLHMEALFIV